MTSEHFFFTVIFDARPEVIESHLHRKGVPARILRGPSSELDRLAVHADSRQQALEEIELILRQIKPGTPRGDFTGEDEAVLT